MEEVSYNVFAHFYIDDYKFESIGSKPYKGSEKIKAMRRHYHSRFLDFAGRPWVQHVQNAGFRSLAYNVRACW